MNDISSIEIGNDKFRSVENNIMKVMVDLRSVRTPAGAYGTSTATAAKQKFSSIDIADNIGMKYVELQLGKDGGEQLDTECKFYIISGGRIYPARKKKIENMLNEEEKDEFKAFKRENKIKWSDPDKLLLLVDLLRQFNTERNNYRQ